MSKFIVIEGLIGVGKTSLCRLLKRKKNARLILEPAEDNPFLAHFYSEQERFAFPTQMFYLASRSRQQIQLQQTQLFSDLFVADYLFEKDQLFAEHTLKGDELDLYFQFSSLLARQIAVPDFVLFLDAPTEVIQSRISNRAIEAEQQIRDSYLDELRSRYYKLWRSYNKAPVYVLDTTMIDYINNPKHTQYVLDMIDGWLEGKPIPGSPEPYQGQTETQMPLFNLIG